MQANHKIRNFCPVHKSHVVLKITAILSALRNINNLLILGCVLRQQKTAYVSSPIVRSCVRKVFAPHRVIRKVSPLNINEIGAGLSIN